MTIFKNLTWAAIYSIIFVNGLIRTVQYFLGMNSIASKVYDLFEEVKLTALL